MNKYNIIFTLEKNLYLEGSPILIEAGALVSNTENKKLHVQAKFKNLSNSVISMIKVGFVLMDSIGREIGRSEKQYIDLKANLNESFGDKVPVYLQDNTVRKFSIIVAEVCFANGSIWTPPENVTWEKIPAVKPLTHKFINKESQEEFKLVYCKQAQFVPFAYKDLWVCACGNFNKSTREQCCSCGAKFADMEAAEKETLRKNSIYRTATELVNKSTSFEIQKGIALFESIKDWKDSEKKAEEAKQKLVVVIQNEQEEQVKDEKRKKKNGIIAISVGAAVFALIIGIGVGNSISNANKYEQAQEYMAQHKYSEAMELLDDLDGYKDANDLYLRASYLHKGDYKGLINKYKITKFTIPDSVTSIGNAAFSGCSSLKSIIIPDSVTSIGYSAFENCSSLTSITIPENVTSIGDSAFRGCNSLAEMTIPFIGASKSATGYQAVLGYIFGYTTSSSFYVSGATYQYSSGYNTQYHYYIPTSLKEVTITGGSIGDSAFSNCHSLTSVVIGDSATSIGDYAFSNCSRLTSVEIGDSVTSIGDSAFRDCKSLKEIVIPDSVTSIDGAVFSWCSSLTSVVIGNGVTSISGAAFESCRSLTSVTIGAGVTSIGGYAFSNCSSLKSIIIPDSVMSISNFAFSNCTNLMIYCEAKWQPSGWDEEWNSSNRPVVWRYTGKE